MKGWNIVGAGIIMICTVVISYWHSFELFDSSAAYNGLFSHFGVIAVETMFLLSGGNIVFSAATGRPPIKSAKIGFWIGSLFVGWSNVAAAVEPEVMEIIYSYIRPVFLTTVKGVLLGVAPPVSLLVSERIFTESIVKPVSQKVAEHFSQSASESTKKEPGWLARIFGRSATTQSTSQPVESANHQPTKSTIDQPPSSGQPKVADQPKPASQPIDQKDESTNQNSQPVADQQPAVSQTAKVSQPETATQPVATGQPANQVVESASGQPTISHSTKNDQPSTNRPTTSTKASNQPTNQVAGSTSHQSTNQPATTKISQPSANHSATSASVNQPAKTTKSANIDQAVADQPKSATTNESASQPTSQKKDSQPATTNQPTKTTKGVAKSTIQPNSKVAEMAEEYRRENGKWPSQRGLAEMAGVTRHQAAKILGWLKKQPADESANQPAKANG